MTTVALIPLRGGSKSIPRKNIKNLAGKPLCAWVLEAATACQHIDKVYVSTEDAEIEGVVKSLDLGVEVVRRPGELARDESSTESVLLHFAEHYSFEALVTIQATSPLLSADDLNGACGVFLQNPNMDSMLSAVRTDRFFWSPDGKPLNYDPQNRPRRQEFEGSFVENGAFYITRRSTLEAEGSRLGGSIGIYEMHEDTFVEIDEPRDWEEVANLLKGRSGQ